MPSPPPDIAALVHKAFAALQAGDIAGAIAGFETALHQAPTEPGLLKSLGALHASRQDWGRAWSIAETGHAAHPGDTHFGSLRADALNGLGFFDAALGLAPASDQLRRGEALLGLGQPEAALAHLKAALAREPAQPRALSLAAEAAYRMGDLDEARRHIERAVALEPENRSLRLARATMLLAQGIWQPGLEDYEYRLRPEPGLDIERRLDLPRWRQGESLAGKRLLVVAEQGPGDQIRFARDLKALQNQAAALIVECSNRLVPIYRRSFPGIAVHAAQERRDGARHIFDYAWLKSAGGADCYIEAGSIGLRLFGQGLLPDRMES